MNVWPIALFSAAALSGCTCGAKEKGGVSVADASPGEASVASSSDAAAAVNAEPKEARFFAPVSAVRGAKDMVFVAALGKEKNTIELVGMKSDGAVEFVKSVMSKVAPNEDADVRVYPAGDGAAIVWRGLM